MIKLGKLRKLTNQCKANEMKSERNHFCDFEDVMKINMINKIKYDVIVGGV